MKKSIAFLLTLALLISCAAGVCASAGTDTPTRSELQIEALRFIARSPDEIAGKRALVMHTGNIRTAPNEYAPIICASHLDDEHPILSYIIDEDGQVWLEIQFGYSSAWISADLVRISGQNTANPEFADYYTNRVCRIIVTSGRARMQPGVEYPILAYVKFGEKYTILDTGTAADNTLWYKIQADDCFCWISSSLASLN